MKKYRILIVDDIPGTIEALAIVLSPDYELSIATNGPDALKIVETDSPDLILLDIVMPGMDGFEVCARLKANEATRNIPVIFITAKTASEDIVKGLEAGAYYYLTKPFDAPTMLAVTTAAISEHASHIALQQEVRRTSDTLALLDDGRFSFQTLEEARNLSILLGGSCPDPENQVFGLRELFVNAVEHGNLGISYDEKSQLNEKDQWEEEVNYRMTLPENRNKRVSVHFERTPHDIRFLIRDQGEGFDWRPFLEIDPKRVFDSHGRGIALSKMSSFDQVHYHGIGNEVLAVITKHKQK